MSRTYILNLLFLINYMCKVGQFCNVGSDAQQMCHTPSWWIYIQEKLERFSSSSQLTSSSLIKEYELPRRTNLIHTCEGRRGQTVRSSWSTDLLLLGFRSNFDQRWLWSTLGPNKLKIGGRFDLWRPYYLAQKSRSKGWPFCCCVDF